MARFCFLPQKPLRLDVFEHGEKGGDDMDKKITCEKPRLLGLNASTAVGGIDCVPTGSAATDKCQSGGSATGGDCDSGGIAIVCKPGSSG